MERRNFFKKIAGVIAGLVIAPFVIEAKEDEIAGYVHEAEWEYVAHWTEIHKRIVQDPNAGYIHDTNEVFHSRYGAINYKIGDKVVSENNPDKVLGICTGFAHDNSCIEIDGKCWGGKNYFMKS